MRGVIPFNPKKVDFIQDDLRSDGLKRVVVEKVVEIAWVRLLKVVVCKNCFNHRFSEGPEFDKTACMICLRISFRETAKISELFIARSQKFEVSGVHDSRELDYWLNQGSCGGPLSTTRFCQEAGLLQEDGSPK